MFCYSFTDIEIEKTARNISDAYGIPYTEVLTKLGITEDKLITEVGNLLQTIVRELVRSNTRQNLKTVWRLLWANNFTPDTAYPSGSPSEPGKYYYLCVNNSSLKCIRDKAVEMYNMKLSELSTDVVPAKVVVEEGGVVAPEQVVVPLEEKKKRAPAKKKESVVAPALVAPVEEVSVVPTVPVVEEKKKRAPAKKKEPVVAPVEEGGVPAVAATEPVVEEKKKRAPAKKKEPVVAPDVVAPVHE
jgi:hypothetical protein